MSTPGALVQKPWSYCNILRDDGLSFRLREGFQLRPLGFDGQVGGQDGDYVEQLTFLLFLKMADEQSKPPFSKLSPIPKGFGSSWLA